MADAPTLKIGEGSPEHIAYKLLTTVLNIEGGAKDRKNLLDTYAECLMAVKQPGDRAPGYR